MREVGEVVLRKDRTYTDTEGDKQDVDFIQWALHVFVLIFTTAVVLGVLWLIKLTVCFLFSPLGIPVLLWIVGIIGAVIVVAVLWMALGRLGEKTVKGIATVQALAEKTKEIVNTADTEKTA